MAEKLLADITNDAMKPTRVTRKGSFQRSGSGRRHNAFLDRVDKRDSEDEVPRESGGVDSRYVCYQLIETSHGYEFYKGFDTQEGQTITWVELGKREGDRTSDCQQWNGRDIAQLKKLSHPHILPLYDSWEKPGKLVLVTEFMSGGSLHGFLSHTTKPRLKVVQNWTRQILRALVYLQSRTPKIVHRDINTRSLLLNANDCTLKLGNFGYAKCLFHDKTSGIVGRIPYRAPEMYQGSYDERVDIYSTALTILEIATGVEPFIEYEADDDKIQATQQGVKPEAIEDAVFVGLQEFVLSCMAADPSHRPTLKELQHHLFLRNAQEPISRWKKLEIRHMHLDGHIDLRLTKTTLQNAETQQQLIDFTLDPSEDPHVVSENMFEEGLIEKEEIKGVAQRIEAVTSFLMMQYDSEEARTLVETEAELQVQLSNDHTPDASSQLQQFKSLLKEHCKARNELLSKQLEELVAMTHSMRRPMSPSSKSFHGNGFKPLSTMDLYRSSSLSPGGDAPASSRRSWHGRISP